MPETTARATVEIRASRADVWRALTDPAEIKQYFMGDADVETDWKVGSPITFRGKWNGQSFEDENYHLVDITLDGDDGATTVTLEQSNLTGGVSDEDRQQRAAFEQNWQDMLDKLREQTQT